MFEWLFRIEEETKKTSTKKVSVYADKKIYYYGEEIKNEETNGLGKLGKTKSKRPA